MSERSCTECVFFEPSKTGGMGKCEYPVPYWIQIGANPFITPIYAKTCSTYKSRQDVVNQEKSEAK